MLRDSELGAAGVEIDGPSTDEHEGVALFGQRIGGVEQRGAGANVRQVRTAILRMTGYFNNSPSNPNVPDPRNWSGGGHRSANSNPPWGAGWETPEPPPDHQWVVQATFSEPGAYVLRCIAHDGALGTYEDVMFVVTE